MNEQAQEAHRIPGLACGTWRGCDGAKSDRHLCSCSAVPLFIGFVESGIPLGVTFSFLIAAPVFIGVVGVAIIITGYLFNLVM